MKRIPLSEIVFDAGTQIRASIDQHVVTDYAEQMIAGATFPPLVVFHDGVKHYLADGFHRFMAAQRNLFRDFDVDVRPGTKEDALWFALGANNAHGHRLSGADKKRAILLAITTWPDRSANQIAQQIGVNPGYFSRVKAQHNLDTTPARVTGRDGKSYPASSPKPSRPVSPQRLAVQALVKQGLSTGAIREATGAAGGTIAAARKDLGVAGRDNSRQAVANRRERLREMASEGYTSRQMAQALSLTEEGCRDILRKEKIDVPADKAVGRIKRHDSNRIIERIVADAENLVEGVNLVEFADLDRAQLAGWLKSLQASRDKLGAFIRRLMKEQQDGEAA